MIFVTWKELNDPASCFSGQKTLICFVRGSITLCLTSYFVAWIKLFCFCWIRNIFNLFGWIQTSQSAVQWYFPLQSQRAFSAAFNYCHQFNRIHLPTPNSSFERSVSKLFTLMSMADAGTSKGKCKFFSKRSLPIFVLFPNGSNLRFPAEIFPSALPLKAKRRSQKLILIASSFFS